MPRLWLSVFLIFYSLSSHSRMSRYISAGIDIGTRTPRVVISEIDKNGERQAPQIIGTESAESRGIRHGYIVNVEETITSVREAIKKAEKQAGARIKRALIAIGGVSLESEVSTGSIMISRVDGEIAESDVEKVTSASEAHLKLLNKKILHRVPLGFKIDGKEALARPQGMHGMRLEAKVLFVTCLDQHLDDFIGAIEGSGIQVEDVVASPIAASLVTLTKPQRTAGCVLANIGAETVSIAVFENDVLVSLQVFPIGSTDITNDIALGLKIPLEEAEGVKTKSIIDHSYAQKKLDDIMEARLGDIFDLIKAHLKKLGRNELLPAGIIITGGGSGITTIEDIAKASLRLPARVVVPHIFGTTKDGTSLDTSWSVAYGLCILGFDNTYSSDLYHIDRIRMKSHLRGLGEWLRQFLP